MKLHIQYSNTLEKDVDGFIKWLYLSDLVSTEHKRGAEAHQGSNDTDKIRIS